MYIGVYFAFGLGSAMARAVEELCHYTLCGLVAGRNVHEDLAKGVLGSPMSFFETTASGKILNRFTSDTYRIDEVIAPIFGLFFSRISSTLVALVIIFAAVPSFLVVAAVLGCVYYYTQHRCVFSSQQLKRLDSESKSLTYNHIQESLAGSAVIRAMQHLDRFRHDLEQRVDENSRAQFASLHANRWLPIRLELIGSTSVLSAGILSVVVTVYGRGVSVGLVGPIMLYATQFSSSLNGLVQVTVNIENNIVAVERVVEYTQLPAEGYQTEVEQRPRASWPEHGSCVFENYSSRYRDGLTDVLRNINIDIKHGEKIGVVGRTGAGKSSLAMALFRIIEATHGHVDINACNIFHIGLETLRQRLNILPQDSAIFAGTVRSNLDPGNRKDDTDLWAALDQARLQQRVSNMEGQLDARMDEGGSNLSTGQCQLISLARVFLRKSPLVVLDEATSAIDPETDAIVQETLRGESFAGRTIITIAHRLSTIMDYDRVVVMENGSVAEFDTPESLLQSEDGLFYALVREAGLLRQ